MCNTHCAQCLCVIQKFGNRKHASEKLWTSTGLLKFKVYTWKITVSLLQIGSRPARGLSPLMYITILIFWQCLCNNPTFWQAINQCSVVLLDKYCKLTKHCDAVHLRQRYCVDPISYWSKDRQLMFSYWRLRKCEIPTRALLPMIKKVWGEMTGGIYDHLLIIGTFCSFIQGMTNTWLLHNLLIPTLYEILQKSRRKNYASAGILGRELLASGPVLRVQGRRMLRPQDHCTISTRFRWENTTYGFKEK